jgi:acetate CoA/acetoacetate CoA-transferase beta subunit
MKQRLSRENIAARVAKELEDGQCVNLGYGMPLLVGNHVSAEKTIYFHAEQGLVGYGKAWKLEEHEMMDYDFINAGGNFVRPLPGMCIVDHIVSFSIIRGGRIDIAVLGALQVSEKGDLANWTRSHDIRQGGVSIGGAMDLAAGANKVIVAMEHTSKNGEPKIVKECSYRLTAKECVDLIVTDLAVIEVSTSGLTLKELAPNWTVDEIQSLTEPKLMIDSDLKIIKLP